MSKVEDEFGELLRVLPAPGRCTGPAVLEALRRAIVRQENEELGLRLKLSSGFTVTVFGDVKPSVTIITSIFPYEEYLGLLTLAREYATLHWVSLESYYFHDTRSAMFGFDSLEDTRQVDTVSPLLRPGQTHY